MRSLFIAAALLLALPVQAEPPWGPGEGRRGPGHWEGQAQGRGMGPMSKGIRPEMLDRIAKRLELDEATREELKKMAFASEAQGIRLNAEVKIARLKLRQLFGGEGLPNRGEVMKSLELLSKSEVALKKHRVGLMLDLMSKLSPTQRKALKEMRGEFRGQGRHRRERRRERRQRRLLEPPPPPGPPPPPQTP